MHLNKKKFPCVVTIFLSLCILLSSCASSSLKFTSDDIYNAENADNNFHTFSQKTETVAKNSFIELGIDKSNHSITVKDIQENYIWSALPEKSNNNAYAFGLTLYTKKGIYHLNTQDNSVAFSASSYKIENDSLTVTYMLSDNPETAKKSIDKMTSEDIFVSFSAVFTMKDQSVNLNIDFGKMHCTDGGFISEFYAMPFFGSSFSDSKNDYFFVPDNSGALMNLDKNDASTDSIAVSVYGQNPYNPNPEEQASAIIPVFGIKRNNSAYSAVITDGDALAIINANRKSTDAASKIFAKFNITDVKTDMNENSFSCIHGKSYNGSINIVYKFLTGNSATYAGMAAAAREEFITNGVLSSSKSEVTDNIPFCLTVVGVADNTKLTTIEQTNDILGILKGKGINNIVLNYKGLLSGGLEQKNLYNASVTNKLGGKDGLEKLHEYTKTQNCTLLLGTNIFSSAKNYLPANKSSDITGHRAAFLMPNELGYHENVNTGLLTRIGDEAFRLGESKANPSVYSSYADYKLNLLNIRKISDKFQTYLATDALSSIDGITVTDAGRILYSDKKTDRQSAMHTLSSLLRAVSNYGKLCVEGGNIYSVYNADLVTGISFDTFYQENENYEAVPFVQTVLHGAVFYTGKPIDAGNPLYRYDMLRYIEYGAIPSYEWIYENANVFCYSGYLLSERISEIVDFYNDANKILSELADDTIVNHRKITKDADGKSVTGVYCTTYSDGTEIYVNYTGNIVSTSENIAIGPYDYVKVKR